MDRPMSYRNTLRPVAGLGAVSLLLSLLAPAAHAQTGARLLLEAFPKELTISTTTDANFMQGGHTQENDESFRLSVYESSGRVRLQPGAFESVRVGWDFTYLELNTTDDSLPEQLVDQSVGVAFPIAKYEDWVLAGSIGVGYSGDTPFGDGDAFYGQATLLAVKQLENEQSLIVLLDYDGNRAFLPDVPLPGFAYSKRITGELTAIIGLPVTSIEWAPNDRFAATLSYSVPYNVDIAVGYKVTDQFRIYGKTESRSDAFFVDGLPSNDDRILFEQKRAELGVAWEPRDGWLITTGVGYAWGGEFSTGFDVRDTDELTDISDEPYVKVGLVARF
jgi:hypothetical protein